jgi:hypothetical protein
MFKRDSKNPKAMAHVIKNEQKEKKSAVSTCYFTQRRKAQREERKVK